MTPIEFTRAQIEGLPLLFNNEDLIKALPDSRCIIILPAVTGVREFLDSVKELRPDLSTDNIAFRYSTNGKELFPAIETPGECPVYIDYRVLQMALLNIIHYHNKPFNVAY